MKEDIIKMAHEAGLCDEDGRDDNSIIITEHIKRFANFVEDAQSKRTLDEGFVTVGHMRQQIAAEREACAKVAFNAKTYIEAAAAIRARGQA